MKLKICGITDIADIEFLNQFTVDYIGFVLHEASVRNVPMFALPKLVAQVSHATPVAVCVNQNALAMQEIYNITGIKVMQLHGDIARAQQHLLPADIIRIYVLHVDASGVITNYSEDALLALDQARDFLLFDAIAGGSGKLIPQQNIIQAAKNFRYFISGGINIYNVAAVLEKIFPYGVDISSGLEKVRGVKDQGLVRDFIGYLQDRCY